MTSSAAAEPTCGALAPDGTGPCHNDPANCSAGYVHDNSQRHWVDSIPVTGAPVTVQVVQVRALV